MAKDQITTIDIGTNSVKVLQLDLAQAGITIVNSGVRSYPRLSASEKIPDEVVIDILSGLIRDRVIRTKPVAIAIPRQLVTLKSLTGLPTSATDADIDKMVPIQVESELPFPLADSVYDTYNLQRLPEGVSLKVVAAKRSSIERYIDIVEEIGLKLKAIIPSVFATYALIFDQYKGQLAGKTLVVVDVGADMTDLCIIRHGRLAFSRGFPFGGNLLTQRYEKEYTLSFDAAEDRKINEADLRSDDGGALARKWAENLATQIDQSILAFGREEASNGIDSLWLCGGGSLVPGLDDYLTDRLETEVSRWDPLQGIEGQPPEDGARSALSVCLGLGVIGIAGESRASTVNTNLLPSEISQKEERARRKIKMVLAAVAAVIVLTVGALGYAAWSGSRAAMYEDLAGRLKALEQQDETRGAKKALENAFLMQQVMTPYVTPLEILREMSDKLPDRRKIALTSLNIDKKGKVTMSVEANSYADVTEMVQILSDLQLSDNVDLFSEVKRGAISKVTKQKRPIFQVQIACSLNSDAIQETK